MLRLAALLASLHVASSDDHSCAAGLTMDVYANGASTNPVRVELDGGHCGTMAAFEAAVSRAACGDPAACHVRDGAGRRVRKCSQLSRSSADFACSRRRRCAYGVRRDMRFVFATEHVGFVRHLPHLGNMTLTTLAERPRLFAPTGRPDRLPKAERPANAAALPGVEARDVDDTIAALRDAMEVQTWEPKLRPDGTLDDYATHGGCPVLDGTKWAANLWVWNKAMPFGSSLGDKGDGKSNDKNPQSVDVTFSTQLDAIEIFWKEEFTVGKHGNAFTVK
ncbi:hypothetical protein JL720_8260 [Aureococcus anophagefferens]|nr:hypothetical protein JL720_8260 [Aureococcus anophagefferens]